MTIPAAESCLRIARTALRQAAEYESQREPRHADALGDLATVAIDRALNITDTYEGAR